MKFHVRRVFGDALVSAGVLTGVLAILMSVDARVREQVQAVMASASSVGIRAQLNEVGSALIDAVQTQSVEHAPLMIFVVAATVLVLWMVRT